jgi:hypothetical protein
VLHALNQAPHGGLARPTVRPTRRRTNGMTLMLPMRTGWCAPDLRLGGQCQRVLLSNPDHCARCNQLKRRENKFASDMELKR